MVFPVPYQHAACHATNNNGRPCSKTARAGKAYCYVHRSYEEPQYTQMKFLASLLSSMFHSMECFGMLLIVVGAVVTLAFLLRITVLNHEFVNEVTNFIREVQVGWAILRLALIHLFKLKHEYKDLQSKLCKHILSTDYGHDIEVLRFLVRIDACVEDAVWRMLYIETERLTNWFTGFWS